jgi:hypothetical protein
MSVVSLDDTESMVDPNVYFVSNTDSTVRIAINYDLIKAWSKVVHAIE